MCAQTYLGNQLIMLAVMVLAYFFCVGEIGFSIGKKEGLGIPLGAMFVFFGFCPLLFFWFICIPVPALWLLHKASRIRNGFFQGAFLVACSLSAGILFGSLFNYPGPSPDHECSKKCLLRK